MAQTRWGHALLSAAALLAAMGSAHAGQFMATGGRTTQPIGHYEFCRTLPNECRQTSTSHERVPLTGEFMRMLVGVNSAVNSAVAPKTDMEIWGQEEVWSYPTSVGDCEDYVLAKRRMLMQRGIQPANLLITVVRQPNGDGHAVLTVRTTGGDFILDNLDQRVLPWERTVYTYLKRQSERNSGVWLSINDGRADAVSSVR